jgi:hypothetical protein
MLQLLAESALRSILLGAAALLGLKILRVRHPQLQMTAWTVVLFVSLAMPILAPRMKVTLPISPSSVPLEKITWIELPGINTHKLQQEVQQAKRPALTSPQPVSVASVPSRWDEWRAWASCLYLVVSGTMLLRLLVGLTVMWRVVRAAHPVRDRFNGDDVRLSDVVTVPATFGSTILLPSACTAWNAGKLQAALLHERSHVDRGDFYVLLLAAIHRAVFWFTPFAWWLFTRLAALAEAASDDDAIAGLGGDRNLYVDVLVEMATAAPQRLPASLGMAHSRNVHRRVLRILAELDTPTEIDWRRRVRIAAVIIPFATLSAVRIAYSTAPPQAAAIGPGAAALNRYVGQFQTGVGSVLTVTRGGDQLFAQSSGQPKLELIAVGHDEFVGPLGNARLSFKSGNGPAAEVTLREPGLGSVRGPRVDPATASELEAAFQRRMAAAPDHFREQSPMPGGEAVLTRTIEALRGDALNEQDMTPRLANKLRRELPMFHASLGALGAVKQVLFRGVGPGGYDVYGVKFAGGSADFRIYVASDGRLEDVNFYPGGDGRPGGVAECALEPRLKQSSATVPIRLWLTNRSGGDVQLSWLNAAGRRVAPEMIENDATTHIWTDVGRPYLVADRDGQCREIILPGETTRFHVIEPARMSATPRVAPLPGSNDALAQFIDGVRRGAPDYERMTPEVAAKTRLNLAIQQAILARLGALQDLVFRGVSPSGNDIYTARFGNGSVAWQIGLLDGGRIGAIAPGPSY